MRTGDAIRAFAITACIVVHIAYAMPSPTPIEEDAYADPVAAAELHAWSNATGIGAERLASWARSGSQTWDSVGRSIRKPFRPFLIATGTGQSWAMFAHPDPTPQQLEVWILRDDWVCIYRSHDPDRRWNHAVLGERRVRGIWDSVGDKGSISYWNFTRWVGRQAVTDYADAQAVRVQLVERTLEQPGELGSTAIRLKREFKRIVFEDDY